MRHICSSLAVKVSFKKLQKYGRLEVTKYEYAAQLDVSRLSSSSFEIIAKAFSILKTASHIHLPLPPVACGRPVALWGVRRAMYKHNVAGVRASYVR